MCEMIGYEQEVILNRFNSFDALNHEPYSLLRNVYNYRNPLKSMSPFYLGNVSASILTHFVHSGFATFPVVNFYYIKTHLTKCMTISKYE